MTLPSKQVRGVYPDAVAGVICNLEANVSDMNRPARWRGFYKVLVSVHNRREAICEEKQLLLQAVIYRGPAQSRYVLEARL